MKKIILKYSLLLSFGFLINNYMQLIPVINDLVSNVASGWIATILMLSAVTLGINAYVKLAFVDKSYKFINAFFVGTAICLIATTIYSSVSTAVLVANDIEIDVAQTFLSRILRLGIIGTIASAIIPLTYKSR